LSLFCFTWQLWAVSINLCLITVNSFFWIDPLVLILEWPSFD
jgi:hypothetical protein